MLKQKNCLSDVIMKKKFSLEKKNERVVKIVEQYVNVILQGKCENLIE